MGRALAMAFLLIAFVGFPVRAQENGPPEEVKAAFLFRFGEYVEWPEPASATPLVIAVMGDPLVARQLRGMLPGRSVQGRPVLAREIDGAQQAADVDILFVGASLQDALRSTVAAATRHPRRMLIVTDAPEGLDAGAAINFVTRDQHVRFEVSPAAAEAKGIKLSSRLLGVAARVTGVP
jgi:hypothetical protein